VAKFRVLDGNIDNFLKQKVLSRTEGIFPTVNKDVCTCGGISRLTRYIYKVVQRKRNENETMDRKKGNLPLSLAICIN